MSRGTEVRVARPQAGCRICGLEDALRVAANQLIWPDQTAVRARDYREAVRRLLGAHGEGIDVKSVTTHANHVERTWRNASSERPPSETEEPVFATDIVSVTNAAAVLGQRAMHKLANRLDALEPKELVAVARLGVGAARDQATLRLKSKQVELTAAAIFGVAAGMADVPEAEYVELPPLDELRAPVTLERRLLTERAAPVPAEDEPPILPLPV